MKIKELSIGDWVRHTFYEENVQIVRIYGDSERVLAERGKLSISCHLNHFEPIPLTPEILEKNGFAEVWGDFVATHNGIYINVEMQENRFGLEVSESGHIIIACDVQHVHQLQRAMNLAGIEKEIEL